MFETSRTDEHSSATYSHLTPDLSGKVSKAEEYYFAIGGNADIWRGKLKTSSGECVVRSQLQTGQIHYI